LNVLEMFLQEQCAVDTLASYQRAQQALRSKQAAEQSWEYPDFCHFSEDAAGTASNAHASHSTQAQEYESGLGQDLPVFRLPGVLVQLPTAVGTVCFIPVFLSKDELDKTWVRQAHIAVYTILLVPCFAKSDWDVYSCSSLSIPGMVHNEPGSTASTSVCKNQRTYGRRDLSCSQGILLAQAWVNGWLAGPCWRICTKQLSDLCEARREAQTLHAPQ